MEHRYVSSARKGVAKHNDGRIVQSVRCCTHRQECRGSWFFIRKAVHIGYQGFVFHAVLHLAPERFGCEPGLRLDWQVQHLNDEQRGMESGAALRGGRDDQGCQ